MIIEQDETHSFGMKTLSLFMILQMLQPTDVQDPHVTFLVPEHTVTLESHAIYLLAKLKHVPIEQTEP